MNNICTDGVYCCLLIRLVLQNDKVLFLPRNAEPYCKGVQVGQSSRVRAHQDLIGGTSKLRIRDINLGDQGTWTCIANNTQGVGQLNFELDVNVPPRIIRKGDLSLV